MKISKQTQRRTIIFAAATALFALLQIVQFGVQLFNSTNPYVGNYSHIPIGQLDTSFAALDIDEEYEEFAYTIERDAEGKPLVEALPTSVLLFSKNPAYVRPDHYGWRMNTIITYAALALFVVAVMLMAWVVLSAIRGFRTGNIFQHNQPRLLRWLALVMFLYYALLENRNVFRMIATKDLYGDKSPIELFGNVNIQIECLIAPLLLLIFAELIAIAARINEEESMTI